MSSPLKVIIFFGSVREGRMGFRVAKYVEKCFKEKNFAVDFFDPEVMKFPLLKKTVSMYPNEADMPSALRDAHTKVKNADAYVVVSAEYNHSIPPALSNLMDHFPIPSFKYKPCSIITYSMGPYGGVRAAMQLRSFLGELGMVTPQFIFAVPIVQDAFSETGEPLNNDMVRGTTKIITELGWYANALRSQRQSQGVPT